MLTMISLNLNYYDTRGFSVLNLHKLSLFLQAELSASIKKFLDVPSLGCLHLTSNFFKYYFEKLRNVHIIVGKGDD